MKFWYFDTESNKSKVRKVKIYIFLNWSKDIISVCCLRIEKSFVMKIILITWGKLLTGLLKCSVLIPIWQVSKTLVINGRAGLLGEQRNNTFCDVACGRGVNSDITYCVTSSGLLCSINSKRVLDTWVELKVPHNKYYPIFNH